MMRKLLFTAAFLISGIITLHAQCTVDPICAAMICPDTVTNLPHATVAVPYNTSITVVVPATITVPSFGDFPIDSINVNSITGLPAGFTYTPSSTGWIGGTSGCILISGTANSTQANTYPLVINATAHVLVMGIIPYAADTALSGYKLVIAQTVGIIENGNEAGISFRNNSEQGSNFFNLNIHSGNALQNAAFTMTDITGKIILHKENLNGSDIQVSNMKPASGIYILSLSKEGNIIAREKIFVD